MSPIITITFSPCIDKSTSVSSLVPEKKLVCAVPKLEPGGGGINVARAIKKLGGQATAIFPSGGYTGKLFNHLVEKENVTSLVIESVNETRENIIVFDESSNNQYRFGMPGTLLREDEWKRCLKTLEEIKEVDFIVASGSLPPGVPHDIYGQIAKIARYRNAKLIVDTSGEALKHALEERIYLVKPNLGELAMLTGKTKIDMSDVALLAKQIIQQKKCEIVVVSLGKFGAMLITKTETFSAKPPDVTPKSTVGAGDSMVAGLVFCISSGKSLEEALRYAVACGTAATINPGTGLCNKKDAEALYLQMEQESNVL